MATLPSGTWSNEATGHILDDKALEALRKMIVDIESLRFFPMPPPPEFIYDDHYRIVGIKVAR